jgi:hypothetical protein
MVTRYIALRSNKPSDEPKKVSYKSIGFKYVNWGIRL